MVHRENLIGIVKNFKLLLIKSNFEKDWRFYIEKTLGNNAFSSWNISWHALLRDRYGWKNYLECVVYLLKLFLLF